MSRIFNVSGNSVMPGVPNFDLSNAIDSAHREVDASPIDHFLTNAIEINKLFTPNPSAVLGNLIILGYVSAVESYFRALFRRMILIDPISRGNCEKKQLSYGAVMAIDAKILPEALFEDISFAGKKNISNSIKDFLGIVIQDSALPPDLRSTLEHFHEVCELRHCIVHRFGKFGSKNAISLGLLRHQGNVEKPIKCDFDTLQQLVTICHNTVRITNNFLFERILSRLILENNVKNANPVWTWDYQKDKKLWQKYFETFYSTMSPSTPLTRHQLYLSYRIFYNTL